MSFVAAAVHRAFTASSTPAIPTGTQAGDVMVAVLGGSSSRTISAAPSGWTLISASDGGGHAEARLYFYVKVAAVSETAPTWTWSGTHWSYAVILTYRDVALPDAANVAADLAVPGTTQAVPGVTTQNDNATVIWAGYWHNNGHTSSEFDGTYTARHRYEGTGAGLLVGEEVRATAGPTGGRTFTVAPGTAWLAAGSLSVEPGSAPVDETDPTVSIDAVHGDGHAESIYDSGGYDPETDTLTVTGVAADEGGSGLAGVEVRVDGGAWQAATGTTSWSCRLDVSGWTPGQHTIEARSTDGAGNVSALDSVTVWHSPSGMWGASASGEGHLIPVQPQGYTPD